MFQIDQKKKAELAELAKYKMLSMWNKCLETKGSVGCNLCGSCCFQHEQIMVTQQEMSRKSWKTLWVQAIPLRPLQASIELHPTSEMCSPCSQTSVNHLAKRIEPNPADDPTEDKQLLSWHGALCSGQELALLSGGTLGILISASLKLGASWSS